ncbi:MAG: hypothetical protein WCA08_17075 [Desulfoferrobacter sp.]
MELTDERYIPFHAVIPLDQSVSLEVAFIEMSKSDVDMPLYALLLMFQMILYLLCANPL